MASVIKHIPNTNYQGSDGAFRSDPEKPLPLMGSRHSIMQRKTYKYRLYPTKQQTKKLEWILVRCCELYNAALQERKEAWSYQKKSISYLDQCRSLTEIKRDIRPEYQEIGAHVLQDVLRRLDKAYQNFFRRIKQGEKPGHPRFQGYRRYDSMVRGIIETVAVVEVEAKTMKRTILIDIDGVLASGAITPLVRLANRVLRLGLTGEDIEALASLNAFTAHPRVQAYRALVGEERYHWQIEALRFAPQCVVGCEVIQGARVGARFLAKHATIFGYCTARLITFNEQWNQDLAAATRSWLSKKRFPVAEVVFCDGPAGKLACFASRLEQDPSISILLVDDSVEKLVQAFDALSVAQQEVLRGRFTLVGFRYSHELHTPFRVVPLMHWNGVQELAAKEFADDTMSLRR